jgi:hypothetical protein
MATISVGDQFPAATLKDIDGSTGRIPAVFDTSPATMIFFPGPRNRGAESRRGVYEWPRYLEEKYFGRPRRVKTRFTIESPSLANFDVTSPLQ